MRLEEGQRDSFGGQKQFKLMTGEARRANNEHMYMVIGG